MRIRGQNFEVTSEYLILRLHDPYWSAWQRFGWPEGTEGYSVNLDAVNRAIEYKKKILVKNKYGDYEITPTRALRLGGSIQGRDGTQLLCIPKTAFKRLPDETKEEGGLNVMSKMVNTPQWEKLRNTFHPK